MRITAAPLLVRAYRCFDREAVLSREMLRDCSNQSAGVNTVSGTEPQAAWIIEKPTTGLSRVCLAAMRERPGNEDLSSDIGDFCELVHECEKTHSINVCERAERTMR